MAQGPSGARHTRVLQADLTLNDSLTNYSVFFPSLEIRIIEPPLNGEVQELHPVLGRDILSHFALFLEERTNRVILLEPEEVDSLNLPS